MSGVPERKKKVRPEKLVDLGAWVAECDARLSAELSRIAEEICADSQIKLIRLVGPTCAGKTTVANMLSDIFETRGKQLHLVSIDDFYYDTDILRARSAEMGMESVDYDSPDTIDIASLEEFVREIFADDYSRCPIFDFREGKRTGYRELHSGERDVFLFEGIQVLYPCVTEIFKNIGHPSVEIYISPQSSIEIGGEVFTPHEIRLMRRIVRDRNFRKTEAELTFMMWQGVRANEEKNIFPFVSDCRYSIDSTMAYEIGILKPYLSAALGAIPANSAYKERADSILSKISRVVPISDKLITPESIYKEFV